MRANSATPPGASACLVSWTPKTGAPTERVFALALDGTLTYMFLVKCFASQWHYHCYLHRDSARLHAFMKSRSKRAIAGCVCPRNAQRQRSGLLADIHLTMEGLTEFVIVHEAIHAAGQLLFVMRDGEAQALLRPYVMPSSLLHERDWREEVQCLTVELCCKQILLNLRALSIPAVPLMDAEV